MNIRSHHFTLFIILLILFIGTTHSGIAQNSIIESLKEQLTVAKEDTLKVDILYKLGYEHWDYDFEIALEYSNKCLELSRRLEYSKGLAQGYTNLGLYSYFKGDYEEAMNYYRLAIQAIGDNIYPNFPAYTLTRIGNLFRAKSDFDSALYYYDLSKKRIPKNPGKIAYSSIFYNTGLVQIQLEMYDSALSNLKKSLMIRTEIKDSLLAAESIKEIGRVFLEVNDYDSAERYFQQLPVIASKFGSPEIEIFYSIYMGDLLLRKGMYQESLDYLKQSLELLKEHDFVRLKIDNLFVLGQAFAEMNEYDKALEYFFTANEFNVPLKNKKTEADIDFEVGYIYYYQNNPKAKQVALRARDQYEKLGLERSTASANNLLGNIDSDEGNYDSALYHYNLGLSSYRNAGDDKGVSVELFNISLVYMETGELEMALKNQLDALGIEKEIGNNLGLIISYNSLGKLYQMMGNSGKVEAYLLQANELLKLSPFLYHQEENMRYLAEYYTSVSNYKKAASYFQEAKVLSDSLYSVEMANRSLRLSSLYELEQKETEIKNLNKDKEIQQSKLDLQKLSLKQQQMFILFTIIIVVFLIVFSYFLFRTIRSLKKTQDKLIISEKEASLGVLVAGLSHEINNPLNYIQGGMSLLKKSYAKWDTEQVRLLELIDSGVSRTGQILSVLSQFEQQRSVEFAACDLAQIIDQSVFLLKEETKQEVKISIKERETPLLVQGNEDQLIQIFVEIIRNGLHAIKGPGQIAISYYVDKKNYVVRIADSGSGIKQQHVTKLEDPFFTTKDPDKGKGLGLFITKFILNEHKAHISYETKPEKGTMVEVSFSQIL